MTFLATQPILSSPFPNVPEIWKCPITGLKVPKQFEKNLEYRRKILERAEKDEGLQRELWAACSLSRLYWLNTFGWTFVPHIYIDARKRPNPLPHQPFITWSIQDYFVGELGNAIDIGEDLGADKSRQMGVTWLIIAVLSHLWLFRSDVKISELSRIEDYVDKFGNDKCLFWKHDYLHERLPNWMRPPSCLPGEKHRVRMLIPNILNGSVIDGEATTKNAVRGGVRNVVFSDEFGACENGEAMIKAIGEATSCWLVNSTPIAGSAYSRLVQSNRMKFLKMPWWEHPNKGEGRYIRFNEGVKKWEIRSPWYDIEDEEHDQAYMAQEHDMNHLLAGQTFFDNQILEQHKLKFGCLPQLTYEIKFKDGIANDRIPKLLSMRTPNEVEATPDRKGKLSLWCKLIEDRNGNLRPDQSVEYVFGIDISKGQGASNSVIEIYNSDSGKKVGEWVDCNTPAYRFARITTAVALWFGGRNPRQLPFLIWEANGDPGIEFRDVIFDELHYPYYYKDEVLGQEIKKKKKSLGFHADRTKKVALLSYYQTCIANEAVENYSELSLEEAQTFIKFNDGGVGPAQFAVEKSGARLAHGDRTSADALAVWGMKSKLKKKNPAAKQAPLNSWEGRFNAHVRKRNDRQRALVSPEWNRRLQYAGR